MPHFEYLLAVGLIVLSVTYGKAIFRVLSLRLRVELRPERVEAGEVPDDIRALLEKESRGLTGLGFEPVAFVRTPCVFDGVDEPSWSRLLQHPSEKSFAWLAVWGSSRTRPCEVTFHAQADEGRRVETHGYLVMDEHPDCPKHVVIDAQTASLAEHWERHQREVAARPDFAPRDVSADELVVEQQQAWKCAIRASIERGRFASAGDGLARYTLHHAVATVVSSTKRDSRRRAAAAKHEKALLAQGALAAPPVGELAPGDVTAEVWAHRRREGAERSRRSGWVMKLGLFGLSVCAAAIAFGMQLSLETLAILFGVLLVHELGHALAMKAFGYRNLQILFIPLFGAVASGSKRDVPPWQEIVVLLAGPVPGIVAGTVLMYALAPGGSPLLVQLAWSMLIVNYLNLLPIMPLDGGRIMNVALFDRYPNLQLGFTALSGVALLGLGMALDEMVLRAIGIVMLVGLHAQWKHSRLLAGARARLAVLAPAAEPADPVPALYTELRQPRFDSLNGESKYQLVTQLAERLLRRPASAGLALMSVLGWLAIMVLPLGIIRYAPVSGDEQAMAKAEAERGQQVATWTAKIAAAATPLDEVRLRLAAAHEFYDDYEVAEAARQLEPALGQLAALGDPELAASVLLLQGQLDQVSPDGARASAEAIARAERHLGRALDLREQRFGVESREVAEVLQAFPTDASADRVGALVRQLRLIGIYERELPKLPDGHRLLMRAHEAEARLRDAGADPERAELALQRAQTVAAAAPAGERKELQFEALYELRGFYFAHDRLGDVRALQDELAALGAERGAEVDRCWLDYWGGDAAAAGCFAALRAQLPKSGDDALRAGSTEVEFTLDEAAALQRTGKDAEARLLLERARQTFETKFHQQLDAYLRAQRDVRPSDDFAGREASRRQAERARVLEPLLEKVADAG